MNIVAVVNRKGGVAKTTTAVNVATAAALQGRRTLIVDLDPQGSVAASLAIEPNGDGASGLFKKGSPSPTFPAPETLFRLAVVPADEELEFATGIRADRLAAGLGRMREHWSLVVLDTPPGLGTITNAALGAADAVVIPVAAEFLAVDVLRSTVGAVRAAEKARGRAYAPLLIVPTMTDTRRRGSAAAVTLLRDRFGELVSAVEVPRSARFDSASLSGLPVVAGAPSSAPGRAYATLTEELTGALRDRPVRLRKRPEVKGFVRSDMREALLSFRRPAATDSPHSL